MRVTIPPGVDGIPTASIPTDPQAFVTWFTSVYLKRWAANGDARNAVPTSASVQITGTIGTPAGIGIGPNSITNGELVERSPLSVMGNPSGVEANVQDIIAGADGESLQRVGGALVFAPVIPTINVADSITGTGSALLPLELVNDSTAPGNSFYYGTNVTGVKGFFPVQGSSITTLTQAGGASQVYNVPSNATTIEVICIGGGGGGGSGQLFNITANCSGGSGGGGGGISYGVFRAADLGSTVTVAFSNAATGGNGGGQKAVTGLGNPGIAGSSVTFGSLLQATGGGNGLAGTTAGSGAGSAASTGNLTLGTPGGNGLAAGAGNAGVTPANDTIAPAMGGGAGGGIANPGTGFAGGLGGGSTFAGAKVSNLPGGTAGAINVAGGNGNPGSGTTGGSGGGGGGGSGVGTGAAGGNGGSPGGGGGGGGTAFVASGGLAGGGGNGAPATCIIIAY